MTEIARIALAGLIFLAALVWFAYSGLVLFLAWFFPGKTASGKLARFSKLMAGNSLHRLVVLTGAALGLFLLMQTGLLSLFSEIHIGGVGNDHEFVAALFVALLFTWFFFSVFFRVRRLHRELEGLEAILQAIDPPDLAVLGRTEQFLETAISSGRGDPDKLRAKKGLLHAVRSRLAETRPGAES